MRKNISEPAINEKYMEEWHDTIIEAIKTGKPKVLKEIMDKVFPFKIKKSGKSGFKAEFNVELDGQPIRKYTVVIGGPAKRSVDSDYGKVSSTFQTITFSEKQASYGVADLEGGMGTYVLNTVARIVLEYTNKNRPKGFDFTAAQSPTNNGVGHSDSRRKAYRALAMMVGVQAGFVNITKQSAMQTGSFFLMQKDLFERWQDAINSSGIS